MVTIYTLPTCGICRVMKMKMQQKNIAYQESNDVEAVLSQLNMERVPILQLEDGSFLTTPGEINAWINAH